jgi:hypothetical protein
MAVDYTIYRVATVYEQGHETPVVHGAAVEALLLLGVYEAGSAQRALNEWFASLPYEQQRQYEGPTEFVVVSSSNSHRFTPVVESRPRLVF